MIIILLVIITLIAYFGGVYVDNRRVGNWVRAICDLLIVVILALMVANDTYHLGMKPQIQTTTTKITTPASNSKIPILLYRQLGTSGKEQIYLYKTGQQSSVKHTGTDQVTNQVHQTKNKAHLVSQRKTWVYQNAFYRLLFGIAGNEGRHIHTKNTFYVPQNWLVLSTKQAKQLQRPAVQTRVAKQVQNQVHQEMIRQLQQHPTMSKLQQRQMINSLTTKYQKLEIKQLIK